LSSLSLFTITTTERNWPEADRLPMLRDEIWNGSQSCAVLFQWLDQLLLLQLQPFYGCLDFVRSVKCYIFGYDVSTWVEQCML